MPQGALEQVNEVARECRRHKFEIYFWCKKEHAEEFMSNLESNILVSGLDLKKGGALYDDLNWVVNVFQDNKAYSAIKDVLMLFVLKEHGGVYLDTTTGLIPRELRTKYKAEQFVLGAWSVTLSTKNFQGFAFPEVGFGGVRDFYPEIMPWELDASPSQAQKGVRYTPSVDYWAAWSTQNNETIKRALDYYIGLIKKMPKGALNTKHRNSIIGDLITMSVQHAVLPLITRYANGDSSGKSDEKAARLLAGFMWPAAVLDGGDFDQYKANFILPSLGVMKWHKGTWRGGH